MMRKMVTYVCVSVSVHGICLHCCTDIDITWGCGTGCLLVVHYWADLHSVFDLISICNGSNTNPSYKFASTPRFDIIVRTRNVSECSVLALCVVYLVFKGYS